MKLSVLIPVYNEANTILEVVKQVQSVDIDKEIILVDDFSTDGTRELLKKSFDISNDKIKVCYHNKNLGKGAAIRTALDKARGEYSIIQDADLEYNPWDYKVLLKVAEEKDADVVYGSRFLKTWRVTSFWHFMVNKFLTVLTNALFGSNLTDMETCYKLLKTDLFKSLEMESHRFEIEPEITAKLLKKGCPIPEVPVSYKGRSYHDGKKICWKDGVEAVFVLLKYRFKDSRGWVPQP
ncbi:MAG: glycosyltransferase family 2 protein [Candidatus Omnitrophota bacterium]